MTFSKESAVPFAAAEAATQVRQWANLSSPPTARDLYQTVVLLGARTRLASLDGALGRTITPRGRHADWRIEIERAAPLPQLRFTLAHEIAHLVLRVAGEDRPHEERWCNAFAAELLMPADRVRQRYGGTTPSFAAARRLADEATVSTRAAIYRLSEVVAWRCSVVEFAKRPQGWVVVEMANVPALASYRLGVTEELRHVLSQQYRNPQVRWLRFDFLKELIEIRAEIVGTGRFRTALIEPDGVHKVCSEIVLSTGRSLR